MQNLFKLCNNKMLTFCVVHNFFDILNVLMIFEHKLSSALAEFLTEKR